MLLLGINVLLFEMDVLLLGSVHIEHGCVTTWDGCDTSLDKYV